MTGPSRFIVTALAGAVLLTGCSTFSDNDIAARVGDEELTEQQLADMLREGVDGEIDDDLEIAPMVDANAILNNFVLDQALRADLAAAGVDAPAAAVELSRVGLEESLNVALQTWQSTPATAIEPSRVQARYDEGMLESNIACTAHILVDTEAVADEMLDRLAEGESFAELAGEHSTDLGSGVNGGILPCDTAGNFQNQYIPEFVEAAVGADVGVPVGPVASQFGFHVIVVRPFAELTPAELEAVLATPSVRFRFAVSDLDVYINPRYGAFDIGRGVVPLG